MFFCVVKGGTKVLLDTKGLKCLQVKIISMPKKHILWGSGGPFTYVFF